MSLLIHGGGGYSQTGPGSYPLRLSTNVMTSDPEAIQEETDDWNDDAIREACGIHMM